ncbi:MAG: dicarboxylate/amino acid:cation symporter [Phenylobacterium sp.]|uniref:dicarboxylate/amino acid:cation symporter n=1 Tax=Phenylobacterium sp. TaxID=1871053 RepID=UPI0027164E4F|nr:dicarboxylate/amino acid:cation symporter [Phenylobacterium sp.]MDO9430961.1 dicarboxylate/amino acid:cation symporter [Phenylobacterium sp.]
MATGPDVQPTKAPARRGFIQRYWFDVVLWKRILAALVLGTIAGLALGEVATQIKWMGDVFIRLIRMVVAPLVFFSIVSGIAGMSDARRLGSIGVKTLALYLTLTVIAVTVGLTIGTLFQPGVGMNVMGATPEVIAKAPPGLGEHLISIIPTNPIASLAAGEIQSVIFFGILVGLGILTIAPKAEIAARVFQAGADVMLQIVRFIMEVAPFGVFALVAWVMGTSGPGAFVHVLKLAAGLIVGCAIQTLLIHGGLIRLVARLPVLPFFRDITDAVTIAFSTSSSAATLPVAMRVAEKNLGVSHTVASTALPLGVTLSMDGTALYVALLAMLSAQAFGVDLTFAQYFMLALTTTVVALGTAPVPSASLFMLAAVLQVIGLSAEQTALVVGFVLPFDRLLDMTRTITNATSDLSVAVTVARWEGELDEEVYRMKPVE